MEALILQALQSGPATVRELSDRTGRRPFTVRKALRVLVALGAVRRRLGKPIRYELRSSYEPTAS